ncbi:MAG: hypothetical protein GKR90_24965 [Pseudomonadales bacterium]|nr:hypothetical protein [Pseudomonadales bacterium]
MLPRERYAWVWLTTLVVVFTTYFTTLSMLTHEELSPIVQFGLLAAALGSLGAIIGLYRAYAYFRGEQFQPDERDRLVEAQATTTAYYVLIAGMIVVGCVLPFSAQKWELVHAALLAIAIAEVVLQCMLLNGYRRGARA